MTWAPALAIGGAILALGPIIIHIIFRRRFRTIDFAAMRFLFEILRRNKQRVRREELIIIALRVLACLLIGFMLANVRSATPFAGTTATTAHVFILDDSLSMGQRIGTTTLFQKALTFISRRLDELPDGDVVGIISATRPQSGEPLGKLVPVMDIKRGNFTSRLAASRPADLVADLAGALREAQRLIKSADRSRACEVVCRQRFPPSRCHRCGAGREPAQGVRGVRPEGDRAGPARFRDAVPAQPRRRAGGARTQSRCQRRQRATSRNGAQHRHPRQRTHPAFR